MKIEDILHLYQSDNQLIEFSTKLKEAKGEKFHLKGTVGSQPAFLMAALYRLVHRNMVFLLNDKEEALYFHNDLQGLMPKKEIFFFPASYKRPYQVEEIDNANVLLRAEVLNEINHTQSGRQIIVTFAEALNEKVVNKKSLQSHTFEITQGANLGMDFMGELLDSYGFEREDYVYEPGQFAIRGGILDIFSFAHDMPYRIEFFGDEIDTIRIFDPVTQISEKKVNRISLIPNIQRSLQSEERVSFLDYISPSTLIFARNLDFVQADLDRLYQKAEQYYFKLLKDSGGGAVSGKPEDLYFSGESFAREIAGFPVIEVCQTPFLKNPQVMLDWKGTAQPAFHKEFSLLADHLKSNRRAGVGNYVFSGNDKQITRLEEIFQEVDKEVVFTGIVGEFHEGFLDQKLRIACYTDHQIFDRYHRFKSKTSTQRSQALTLKQLRELSPGDYVVHVSHGIGRFAGLHTIQVGEHIQEAAKIIYTNGDAIFVNVNALHKVSKYSGKEGTEPQLSKLGSGAWARAKAKTKSRIKELAYDLVSLYAKRKVQEGFAFNPDTYLQRELEASFMYEDTPDQVKTMEDVKQDMEKPHPMDRLVCGDVGFGKTEIAIRAAFKAAADGKQTAVLVPTTILALQHFKTFSQRLKDMPVTVDYVNRFKSSNQIKDTLDAVAEGKTDILIGTHRLVSKDVKFKNLGLLVIDEEQRFGVNVKDKLKVIRETVDTLTLTATPIPRTLQFSLAGIRDLSVIGTPPPNRQPIETVITTFTPTILRDALAYELKRGGQVFFIHPRVKDITEIAGSLKKLVPDARIRIAHGQMPGDDLEDVMSDFIEGAFDILVSTTIVESGLDIPNANTIIINEANNYGLADLHQMRGRVGRSNRKAFCYLLAPPEIALTQDARKRLKAMEEFSDLGSGFHIALRDLDIRGAGDLLGAEQSGFISEIGYDLYHKILDEAVRELKEEYFSDLFEEEIKNNKIVWVDDCKIDLDLDIRLPEAYVPSIPERLQFYRRIAAAETEDDLVVIATEMTDRFGKMPPQVSALFDATRIREAASRVGIERVVLKGDNLRLFFVSDRESSFYQSEAFNRMIDYVQTFSAKVTLKQSEKFLSLVYEKVKDIETVLDKINDLVRFVYFKPEENPVS
ncbi:MAG: transcription-repair coupling factor [Bacteroidia bacterium]|nr:transcription-repair coupling factor [Bacteroidia bacterium]